MAHTFLSAFALTMLAYSTDRRKQHLPAYAGRQADIEGTDLALVLRSPNSHRGSLTILARPSLRDLNVLLLKAGCHPQFTRVVIGHTIAPTHSGQRLLLTAWADTLPTHAFGPKGTHHSATGL